MSNNKEPEYRSLFGIINRNTGEVTHEVINPSEEDKKLIAEKENRYKEQMPSTQFKTVKKVSSKPSTTTPITTSQTATPGKVTITPKKVNFKPVVKPANNLTTEYLIGITLEQQDQTTPDWENTRFIKVVGRKRAFVSLVSMIDDLIDGYKIDFYDPVDYEESFVVCTGVRFDDRISLLEFIELCFNKEEGLNSIDDHMLRYLKAVLKSYAEKDFSYVEQWVEEESDREDINCTPQIPQMPYNGDFSGEDIE